MKQSNICGIYEIRNKVNNKIYIGSSSCIISRWASHRHMLNNNKHSNIHLQRPWNTHGSDNFRFSILEECEIANLLVIEQKYLDSLPKNSYNIAIDAIATSRGVKQPPRSDEYRKWLSVHHTGRIITPEWRAKISKTLTGRTHNRIPHWSEESRKKLAMSRKGKIASEETRKKQSDSHKGKTQTSEWVAKRSGENTKRSKLTNEIVLKIRELHASTELKTEEIATMFNVTSTTIRHVVTRHTWKHI